MSAPSSSSSSSASSKEMAIFKLDNSTIDVLKVLLKIWECRRDEEMVKGLAETLSSFTVERKTLNEIEFYLPQIAHLVIHVEANWNSQTLEYLAIAISQTSIHAALQLSYFFIAAMEDYQPEQNGKPNPKADFLLYYRCARLLQNISRAVVYGSPILTVEQERYMAGQFSQTTLDDMYDAEKTEAAGRIVRSNMYKSLRSGVTEGVSGRLYVNSIGSSVWSQCFCKVEQRVLFCFKDNAANSLPMKAVLLEGCFVRVVENSPRPFSFEVYNPLTLQRFILAASEQSDLANWVRFLQTEATRAPLPASSETSLSPGQTKRYLFYTQTRAFNTALITLSEIVRKRPEPVRKFFLKKYAADLAVPPLAYLPTSLSLDKFKHILKVTPSEASALSLPQCVPCTIFFETEMHSAGLDVATFLNKELQEYDEDEIRSGPPPRSSSLVLDRPAAEEDDSIDQPRIFSMLRDVKVNNYWKLEGTGMEGLDDRFAPPLLPRDGELTFRVNRGKESIPVPVPETLRSRAQLAEIAVQSTPIVPGKAPVINSYMARLRDFEISERKAERMRAFSPAGHLPNWRMSAVTACAGFDSRQECIVSQLITYYAAAFEAASLPVNLQGYKVVPTSKLTGLVEAVPSAHSLKVIKAHADYPGSLSVYFEKGYGGSSDTAAFKLAVENFVASMAAYSVICYLLGIRGRHDGNVFLTEKGHIFHTDFQQIFAAQATTVPLNMHSEAPFLLTREMVNLMGGRFSPEFANYASLCGQCMLVARKHFPQVNALLEMFGASGNGAVASITPAALAEFRARHIFGTPDLSVEFEFNFLIERAYNDKKSATK